MKTITFFERLVPSIVARKKTITIRDESENNYHPGEKVDVYTLESNKKVGQIKVVDVSPLHFDDINDSHAVQEHMTLHELKSLIREIYPATEQFYMIEYRFL